MPDPADYRTIGMLRKSVPVEKTEQQWHRDMPAYKRLRMNGLQPRSIDGCAELETRAHDRIEVEMGHVFPDRKDLAKAQEGMRLAEELRLGLV